MSDQNGTIVAVPTAQPASLGATKMWALAVAKGVDYTMALEADCVQATGPEGVSMADYLEGIDDYADTGIVAYLEMAGQEVNAPPAGSTDALTPEQLAAREQAKKDQEEAAHAEGINRAANLLRRCSTVFGGASRNSCYGYITAGGIAVDFIRLKMSLGHDRKSCLIEIAGALQKHSAKALDINRMIQAHAAWVLLAKGTKLYHSVTRYSDYRDDYSRLTKGTKDEVYVLLPGLEEDCRQLFTELATGEFSREIVTKRVNEMMVRHADMVARNKCITAQQAKDREIATNAAKSAVEAERRAAVQVENVAKREVEQAAQVLVACPEDLAAAAALVAAEQAAAEARAAREVVDAGLKAAKDIADKALADKAIADKAALVASAKADKAKRRDEGKPATAGATSGPAKSPIDVIVKGAAVGSAADVGAQLYQIGTACPDRLGALKTYLDMITRSKDYAESVHQVINTALIGLNKIG